MIDFKELSLKGQREYVTHYMNLGLSYDTLLPKHQAVVNKMVNFYIVQGKEEFIKEVHRMMTPPKDSKLEEQLRAKQAFIDDAKVKIREMNMEYFGMSSDQLSDLKKQLDKNNDILDEMVGVIEKFSDGKTDMVQFQNDMKQLAQRIHRFWP